jgi:hypothetical protein
MLGLCGAQNTRYLLPSVRCAVLPTKTSLSCIQSIGSPRSLLSACSQVFTTRLVNPSVRFILVAIISLSVSLSLITRSHHLTVSSSTCLFPWMVLSHLSTRIRHADSERGICRSRDSPRSVTLLFAWFTSEFSALVSGCGFIHLQPRIVPSPISSHRMFGCGRRSSTSDQVILGGASHCVDCYVLGGTISLLWGLLYWKHLQGSPVCCLIT